MVFVLRERLKREVTSGAIKSAAIFKKKGSTLSGPAGFFTNNINSKRSQTKRVFQNTFFRVTDCGVHSSRVRNRIKQRATGHKMLIKTIEHSGPVQMLW